MKKLSILSAISFLVEIYGITIFVFNILLFLGFVIIINEIGLESVYMQQGILFFFFPVFYLLVGTLSLYAVFGRGVDTINKRFLRWTGLDIRKNSHLFFLNSLFVLISWIVSYAISLPR